MPLLIEGFWQSARCLTVCPNHPKEALGRKACALRFIYSSELNNIISGSKFYIIGGSAYEMSQFTNYAMRHWYLPIGRNGLCTSENCSTRWRVNEIFQAARTANSDS